MISYRRQLVRRVKGTREKGPGKTGDWLNDSEDENILLDHRQKLGTFIFAGCNLQTRLRVTLFCAFFTGVIPRSNELNGGGR